MNEGDLNNYPDYLLNFHNFNKLKIPISTSGNHKEYEIAAFNNENFERLRTIGYSIYLVKRVLYKPRNLTFAAKIMHIPKKRIDGEEKIDENELKKLLKETKIIFQLQYHENIIELYGLCLYEDNLMLCMEYMDMSLADFNTFLKMLEIKIHVELFVYLSCKILDGLEYRVL